MSLKIMQPKHFPLAAKIASETERLWLLEMITTTMQIIIITTTK